MTDRLAQSPGATLVLLSGGLASAVLVAHEDLADRLRGILADQAPQPVKMHRGNSRPAPVQLDLLGA